jgi:hypothetical protein
LYPFYYILQTLALTNNYLFLLVCLIINWNQTHIGRRASNNTPLYPNNPRRDLRP